MPAKVNVFEKRNDELPQCITWLNANRNVKELGGSGRRPAPAGLEGGRVLDGFIHFQAGHGDGRRLYFTQISMLEMP
ncbi:MAG: hypothetical protein AAB316_11965 [Bacteroidota bacterium]